MTEAGVMTTEETTVRGTLGSDGYELAYVVEGQGPPALVIGSRVYDARTWSPELRRHLRMAFVDHRGFARPTRPIAAGDFELDVILADTERLRAHLGLGKVVVIGHSGHGYMALEYARRHPEHVSHVVVVATGPSHAPALVQRTERHWEESVCPERKARLEADLRLLADEVAAAPEQRFIRFCVRMGARAWYDPAFDAAPLWAGVHVNMPAFDRLWGEVFRDVDIREVAAGVEAPVLLALGRFDYLVAPHFAWEPYRDAFRDLTVRVFDRSGHTPQLEEAEVFDRELLAWLAARPGR